MMNKLNRIGRLLFGVLLFTSVGNIYAQQAMSLDGVITQAAKDVEARISAGAKLAVLNFTSSTELFSDYVIEELTGALVMNRKVTVIERKSLDLIRKEMNLQLSGDVSDDSAQAIGRQLGAQAIVTGSLTNLGDTYRFRVKVINVETARIEAQFSYNLGNNQQVAFLLNGNQQSVPPPNSGQERTVQNTPQTTKVYKIGDIGPAGGLIFYDKGNNSGGWRYLEVAPADTERQVPFYINYSSRTNSSIPSTLNTEDGLGAGKKNTELICSYLSSVAQWDMSAQVCADLNINGYRDWYMPSFMELSLIYGNLHRKGLGNFQSNGGSSGLSAVYYSSTLKEYTYNRNAVPMSFNFADGSSGTYYTEGAKPLRAIRQF